LNLKQVMDKIRSLPPEKQQAVIEFIETLASPEENKGERKLGLSWAGGLSDMADQYTGVELQHKILDLWGKPDVSG
jgi:hypothetical protein